ncbi:hypothetical protein Tco_0367029 [Tanacetum coccineum]
MMENNRLLFQQFEWQTIAITEASVRQTSPIKADARCISSLAHTKSFEQLHSILIGVKSLTKSYTKCREEGQTFRTQAKKSSLVKEKGKDGSIFEVMKRELVLTEDPGISTIGTGNLCFSTVEEILSTDERIAQKLNEEEMAKAAAREEQERIDFEKALELQKYIEEEYNKIQTLFKKDTEVEKIKTKRVAEETLLQESFKKLRTTEASSSEPIQEQPTKRPKELSEEELKKMLEIVPVEEIKAEALQVKDQQIPIFCMAVLPSSRLCGELDLTMTKFRVSVLVKRPSPIVTSRGTYPIGQECSPEKPTSGNLESTLSDLIEGFNFRKHCS